MSRGYAAIGLHDPKSANNVGQVLRAAGCYGASLLVIAGDRGQGNFKRACTDTQKAWRHIPTQTTDDLLRARPVGAEAVAVDLVDGAVDLARFAHPEQAYYIFGPEDGTLSPEIVSRCKYRVMIPTRFCMNLAATVNVVLYDRLAKRGPA